MKKRLLKLLNAKNAARSAKMKLVDDAQTVEELRTLQKEVDAIDSEIRDLQAMIDDIPDENDPADTTDPADPTDPVGRTAAVNGQIPGIVSSSAKGQESRKKPEDEGNMEYRKAFMQLVTKGTPIPKELRSDESTLTSDVSSVIPEVLVNRIIEKMESIGMILPLVSRTNFNAGVKIPTSSVKPVATWVNEGAGSDRQKKTTGYISFTYYKLRCEISMSMEVGVMALSAFETTFVKQTAEAMVKAIEAKIISTADGTTGMKGILAETPATGQAMTAKKLSFELLCDAEGVLPQAYEGGAVWCMTKKTFMSFVGMTDAEGQPIARVNYGIGGKPERSLLGRTVVLCADYLDSFSSSLTAGKVFAFLFDFSDYVVNTIYDMGVQRMQDWDTEDLLTKAVMSVDGKALDKNSLVTIAMSA